MTDATVILTREAILAVQDTAIELVAVPEWGGSVYVKSLTGRERDSFEAGLVSHDGKNIVKYDDIRARLVSRTACDSMGKRLFTEADVYDLTKKSAAALQRVFEVAQRLSGIAEGSVEEVTGELKNDPSEGSTSD